MLERLRLLATTSPTRTTPPMRVSARPKEASTIYTTFGLQPGGVTSWGQEHARSFILDKQVVRGQGEVAYAEAQRDTRENLQVAL